MARIPTRIDITLAVGGERGGSVVRRSFRNYINSRDATNEASYRFVNRRMAGLVKALRQPANGKRGPPTRPHTPSGLLFGYRVRGRRSFDGSVEADLTTRAVYVPIVEARFRRIERTIRRMDRGQISAIPGAAGVGAAGSIRSERAKVARDTERALNRRARLGC